MLNIIKNNLNEYQKNKIRSIYHKFINLFYKKNIGKNTFIDKSVSVLGWKSVSIGRNSALSQDTWININHRKNHSKQCVIGDFCYIGKRNFFSVGENISIGSYTMTSTDCRLLGSNHLFDDPYKPYMIASCTNKDSIIIGVNVCLSSNVTVVGNVNIGHGSIIGAGSLVNKDIPPFSIAVGNPCKVIKRYDFENNKWIKVQNYNNKLDSLIPLEEDYLNILKQNYSDIKMPLQACSKNFGDIY
ncbi:acyltransferase [Francisella adeliensis]|uniref:acyltransferase n=1 Tax=Francisella adeliensis TaxID=2007306 RepID=UPI001902F9F2|nr:acyltransferase [Francisella adeliensis]MBK2085594.1 acyltransferase [Francisella adeliensis]MBK2097472.1 acyltransferase [Francisella adeliensis]